MHALLDLQTLYIKDPGADSSSAHQQTETLWCQSKFKIQHSRIGCCTWFPAFQRGCSLFCEGNRMVQTWFSSQPGSCIAVVADVCKASKFHSSDLWAS